MSEQDALMLLRAKCDELGQSTVAKAIGKSPSAVNQLYHGNYKGAPGIILAKVVEIYGSITLPCPFRDEEISLKECAEHRGLPFDGATNSYLVRFFRACRNCGGKQ